MIYILGAIFVLNLISTLLFGYFYYKFEDFIVQKPNRYWRFAWPFFILIANTIFAFCAVFSLLGG